MTAVSIFSALFALACGAAAFLSSDILGPGPWAWIMLIAGVFVGASPHFKRTRMLGGVIALIAAIPALLAVVLGLLAATIGGSFKLPADQAWLLAMFGLIGVCGILLFAALQKK